MILSTTHVVVFGFDKGPETMEGGVGVQGAVRRDAVFGKGSPLQPAIATRPAIDSVIKGDNGHFLQKFMNFFEVPPSQRCLAGSSTRPMPEQLNIDPAH
jgi:hypothetical protein